MWYCLYVYLFDLRDLWPKGMRLLRFIAEVTASEGGCPKNDINIEWIGQKIEIMDDLEMEE